MNKIKIKFSLEGDKLMPEMHLRQPAMWARTAGFIYIARGSLTENKERIQKI